MESWLNSPIADGRQPCHRPSPTVTDNMKTRINSLIADGRLPCHRPSPTTTDYMETRINSLFHWDVVFKTSNNFITLKLKSYKTFSEHSSFFQLIRINSSIADGHRPCHRPSPTTTDYMETRINSSIADGRRPCHRPSPTVTDHMETRINSSIADGC